MLESICDLQLQFNALGFQLHLFHDRPEHVISHLNSYQKLSAVFVNRDYTPFSRTRDEQILQVCKNLGIKLHVCADLLLTEPEQSVKDDQTPYKVFTAFYNNAKKIFIAKPQAVSEQNFLAVTTHVTLQQFEKLVENPKSNFKGGRAEALNLLREIDLVNDYQNTRDFPALNSTTKLSPHIKFGTCSVREVYYAISDAFKFEHPLLRQLYWRDFFTHIAYHFPHVFRGSFNKKFTNLTWIYSQDHFKAWCTGETGFPIVDAGMRELNSTGFMHNRVRMITGSFLVKDLHIDWRWGERYFAEHLVDYDPCVNNGNWQWLASTGCDSQPYFRIFNPWNQQKKFDPDCSYIHQWIPELQDISPQTIHELHIQHKECQYPFPIVDHAKEIETTKLIYKNSQFSN